MAHPAQSEQTENNALYDDLPELENVPGSSDEEGDNGDSVNILDQAIIEDDVTTESCITTGSD